ncbi:hypothetical protein DFJ74DRAFT_654421 [Hyaloraphidium curvatum]|nr:hypothetical protein DFJ74DRAFT_654421 [Hyaloraphidium curvatum]
MDDPESRDAGDLPPFDAYFDALQLALLATRPSFARPDAALAVVDRIALSLEHHVHALDARTEAAESRANLQALARQCTPWLVRLLDSMSAEESAPVERVAALVSALSGKGSSGPVVRRFRFGDLSLRVREPPYVEAGIGWQTWGAAVVFAKLVHAGRLDLKGRTVLELGCGTGLAGLMVYLAGGAEKVLLTDYQEALLRNAAWNVGSNVPEGERDRVAVRKLDWRDFRPGSTADGPPDGSADGEDDRFDSVVAADCVFELEHGELVPLVADRFLRTSPRAPGMEPECHVVLPLREKYAAEVARFEEHMGMLVARGRLEEEGREDMELEEDDSGLVYRWYRFRRPAR